MSQFQRPRSRAHLLVLALCVGGCLAYGLSPRLGVPPRGPHPLEHAVNLAGSAITPGLGAPLAAVLIRARKTNRGVW